MSIEPICNETFETFETKLMLTLMFTNFKNHLQPLINEKWRSVQCQEIPKTNSLKVFYLLWRQTEAFGNEVY